MNETKLISSPRANAPQSWTRPAWLGARYCQDHQHPVNHFLHVGVGWPMAAIAVILIPFRPLWSVFLLTAAYAIMFVGHFVFERNVPTVLRQPSTPLVIAGSVIRGLWTSVVRLALPPRAR
jgi:hypothetical protein